MPILRITTIAVAALALAGCSGHSTPGNRAPALAMIGTESNPASFPAAAAILEGFELSEPGQRFEVGTWRSGDRVLLGLRIVRRGKETVRYLEVEQTSWLADPRHVKLTVTPHGGERAYVFRSPELKTHLRLYDERGKKLAEVDGGVPMILLNVGLYDSVRRGLDFPDKPYESREDFARSGLGGATLLMFSASVAGNRVFRDLLAGVVERPALWRLLLDRSVALELADLGPADTDPWAPTSALQRPAVLVPLELEVAGSAVLRGRVTVVPQDAPLGLCGGVVLAEAYNPSEPESRLVIRLLAAQRGPYVAPKEIPPAAVAP